MFCLLALVEWIVFLLVFDLGNFHVNKFAQLRLLSRNGTMASRVDQQLFTAFDEQHNQCTFYCEQPIRKKSYQWVDETAYFGKYLILSVCLWVGWSFRGLRCQLLSFLDSSVHVYNFFLAFWNCCVFHPWRSVCSPLYRSERTV